MSDDVRITYRGLEPTPALDATIRRKAGKLSRLGAGRLLGCHVTLSLEPMRAHPRGPEGTFRAIVELHVRGDELVVGRDHRHATADNAYVAVRDAFRSARRLVEHRIDRSRGYRQRPMAAALAG